MSAAIRSQCVHCTASEDNAGAKLGGAGVRSFSGEFSTLRLRQSRLSTRPLLPFKSVKFGAKITHWLIARARSPLDALDCAAGSEFGRQQQQQQQLAERELCQRVKNCTSICLRPTLARLVRGGRQLLVILLADERQSICLAAV